MSTRTAGEIGAGAFRASITCIVGPREFEGGDLVIYDRRGTRHAVPAEHNSAVFFPADLPHEVQRVTCRTQAFADSRFSINVWIM